VVVTGASGWLGQNLVRALAKSSDRVRCLVTSSDGAALLEVVGPAVDVVVGDVRDPAAVDALFEGIDGATVFHAAAVIHPAKRTREFFDVNVGGTQLVLDRSRRAGAARFVHVSSNSPFGANRRPTDRFTEDAPYDPYLGYGKSKLEAELLVRQTHDRGDVAAVIVRAPWFYGPHQPERQTRFFATVRRGRFPIVGPGTQQRSMVFTAHLVDGLVRAATADAAPGRAYWIADAEPYELRAIITAVRRALDAEGLAVSGRPPTLPAVVGRGAARADAVLQSAGLYVQPLHVLGELKDTIACDISRARAELGYEPTTTLVDGMRASIRSCLERGDPL